MHRAQASVDTATSHNIFLCLWWRLISSGSGYLRISQESEKVLRPFNLYIGDYARFRPVDKSIYAIK